MVAVIWPCFVSWLPFFVLGVCVSLASVHPAVIFYHSLGEDGGSTLHEEGDGEGEEEGDPGDHRVRASHGTPTGLLATGLLYHLADNIRANGTSQKWAPLEMLPGSGSIP